MKNFNVNKLFKILFFWIFLSSIFFFSSCSTYYKMADNTTWKLIYENDQEGNTINGDINLLIGAIRDGKEVRILTYTDEQQYLTDAENIWVRNGIVYLQNSSNISVSFKGDNLFIQDDAYHWYFTVNTKGERNMSRWLVGEHTPKGTNSDRISAKWFVR